MMQGSAVAINVERRDLAFDGRKFGRLGSYELIAGRLSGGLDSRDPTHARVALIDEAKRLGIDLRYASDFCLLRPVEAGAGNGTLLLDVLNRGEQKAFSLFNRATAGGDPREITDPGDDFLMNAGYSILWLGWQPDIAGDAVMKADFPVLRSSQGVFTGRSVEEFILDSSDLPRRLPLSYPAADLSSSSAQLTRRSNNRENRKPVSAERWRFISPTEIEIGPQPDFDPGNIFELVYDACAPVLTGTAFAMLRDGISHLRNGGASDLFPAGALQHAIAFGTSQSGRFLRDFLWQGFNRDASGRPVFDGFFIDCAGARRAFINAPFAQPGRFSRAHEDHFYPDDQFPFGYQEAVDPLTGRRGALLSPDETAKIFHTDSSSEFWQGRSSLVMTDGAGKDVVIPDNVRVYTYAGVQHGGPNARPLPIFAYPTNPVSEARLLRALLLALTDWVTAGKTPPDSCHPTIAEGTLVDPSSPGQWKFPDIPGVRIPLGVNPLSPEGREFKGQSYRQFVPAVDDDGNEVGGIRLPDIAVPVATYCGWNIRRKGFAEGELASVRGSLFPYPVRDADRRPGDARPSLQSLYPTRADFVAKIAQSVDRLVAQGFLLPEDGRAYVTEAEFRAMPWLAAPPARVPVLARDDLAAADQEIYDAYIARRGVQPSLIHRAIANAPDVLRAYMPLSNALRYETELSGKLRELAIVAVGVAARSPYEVEAHVRFALATGVRPDVIQALVSVGNNNVFEPIERMVIDLAQAATCGNVSSAQCRGLRSALGEERFAELAMQIVFYNMVVRILAGLDLRPAGAGEGGITQGIAAPAEGLLHQRSWSDTMADALLDCRPVLAEGLRLLLDGIDRGLHLDPEVHDLVASAATDPFGPEPSEKLQGDAAHIVAFVRMLAGHGSAPDVLASPCLSALGPEGFTRLVVFVSVKSSLPLISTLLSGS
ncbi:carboxymuconolactone decarboxylase family protein [Sinorhizobium meliloti]|uniref:alpha/beta hydrolase domain-containing protein n=1 Tax=Rhizobium meliloti TaxID=382 RepID=UPI003F16D4D4